MGLRTTMEANPRVTVGVTSAAIVLAIVAIIYQITGGNANRKAAPKLAYFTVDDGATYFADDINKVPPYTHDGKTAVRAYVIKGASGKPWVAYLQRYTPGAKAGIEKLRAINDPDSTALQMALGSGMEVKKPLTGDTGWVAIGSTASVPVVEIRAPAGVTGALEPAFP